MAQWLPWRKKKDNLSSSSLDDSSLDVSETPAEEKDALNAPDFEPVKPETLLVTRPVTRQSLWRRSLARLRQVFLGPIDRLFRGRPFSEELLSELEEALITADVGVKTATV